MKRFGSAVLISALLILIGGGCQPAAQTQAQQPETARGTQPAREGVVNSGATQNAAPATVENASREIAASEVIWKGESGGFVINWTTGNITSSPSGQPQQEVFSAWRMAREDALSTLGESPKPEDWPYRDYQHTYKILSVVGALMSIEDELVYANPGTYIRRNYTVIDMSNPSRKVSLTDIFPEAELLTALLADRVIQAALKKTGMTETPKTVAALVKVLDENHPKNVTGEVYFESGMLNHFAFHRVQDGKVSVRLGIPLQSGMRDESLTQIGLLLNVPPAHNDALQRAAAGKEGFLMKDANKISSKRGTIVDFDASVVAERTAR